MARIVDARGNPINRDPLAGVKKCVIGGPAYGMQVSAKHAATLVYLAQALRAKGWKVDVWHRHSSILVENRDSLLRGCIEQHVDVFISIDSDTYLDDENVYTSVMRITEHADFMLSDKAHDMKLYCAVAPVIQRNGKWNVVGKDGAHYESCPEKQLIIPDDDVEWCAFAFAIHRIASYWEWYDSGEPFYHFGYVRDRANKPGEQPWIGEDSFHSMVIKRSGGRIIIDPVIRTGHAV